MVLPDINLLIYAYNEAAPLHAAARAWWENLLTHQTPIALPWVVILGFIRLTTHPAVLATPLPPQAALDRVERWISRNHVLLVEPGPRHFETLSMLFKATGVGANLTTDTHLAALAIEHQCELHSNDTDFSRFPGLRWENPLA